MRRSWIALILFLVFTALWIAGEIEGIPGLDNRAITTIVAVALVLAYYYLRFEEKESDSKVIAMLAALAALAIAGRVLMAGVPNIQPSTFIIVVSGYVFGPLSGFMVGSTTALVSNFFLGQGPWTLWQMLAWGLAGILSGLLGRGRLLEGRWRLSLYCGAWGFIYGWILNAYFLLGFVYPLTWNSVLATYGAGLWFDLFHALGNFAFAFALGPGLVKMLERYKKRFSFEPFQSDPTQKQADTVKIYI